jgi:hypothetical protein
MSGTQSTATSAWQVGFTLSTGFRKLLGDKDGTPFLFDTAPTAYFGDRHGNGGDLIFQRVKKDAEAAIGALRRYGIEGTTVTFFTVKVTRTVTTFTANPVTFSNGEYTQRHETGMRVGA